MPKSTTWKSEAAGATQPFGNKEAGIPGKGQNGKGQGFYPDSHSRNSEYFFLLIIGAPRLRSEAISDITRPIFSTV